MNLVMYRMEYTERVRTKLREDRRRAVREKAEIKEQGNRKSEFPYMVARVNGPVAAAALKVESYYSLHNGRNQFLYLIRWLAV